MMNFFLPLADSSMISPSIERDGCSRESEVETLNKASLNDANKSNQNIKISSSTRIFKVK